jgi:hypothetical protein
MAAVLAKHADEKKALEEGSGRIGQVILKSWGSTNLDERQIARILAGGGESVLDFVKRIRNEVRSIENEFYWGRVPLRQDH